MEREHQEKRRGLAVRVLEACRNQLFFRYRFLEQALFRLEWAEREDICFGNEGKHLYYNNKYILNRYSGSPGQMEQDYLHTVMHCLYQHPFFSPQVFSREQEACWNLAADIAVECVLEEMAKAALGSAFRFSQKEARQRGDIIQILRDEIGLLSAQKIFAYLQKNITPEGKLFGTEIRHLCKLFQRDEHRIWYLNRGSGKDDIKNTGSDRSSGSVTGGFFNGTEDTDPVSRGELQQIWKNVAGQVLMEAGVFSHSGRGDIADSMLQNLKKLTRENYDYSEFLMKFATHLEERMQTDEDEFDYVFYTYGLKLFGKVPLIEPLEYKEKNLIREFIIAIDTSGSCQGEVVEGFLTKTYNILRQAKSFTTKVNIHIVQCDACIQEDTKIESQKELEEYIANLTLKGFGGTDFTPVFAYANQLLETGEIRRLDGLLYFTDGYGSFPVKPPKYKTAFVFLNQEEDVKVPPWAMKVYLEC